MAPSKKDSAATRRPEKSKQRGKLAKPQAKSGNAQIREQIKRANQRNIDQQGNRANVRQNTTRQGNRRSA